MPSTQRRNNFKIISSTNCTNSLSLIDETIDTIRETLSWLQSQLIIHRLDEKQLTIKLIYLERGLIELTYASTNYNFADTPINGFTAFVDLVISFIYHLQRKHYFDSAQSISDLEAVVTIFLKDLSMMFACHAKRSCDKDPSVMGLITQNIDEVIAGFLSNESLGQLMETMNSNFLGFWANSATIKWLQIMEGCVSFSGTRFPNCTRVFCNPKYRRSVFYQSTRHGSAFYPLKVLRISDSHFSRRVFRNLLSRHPKVVSKTFYIQPQGRWTVSSELRGVVESKPVQCDKLPLRCRYHQHRDSPNKNSTLIFYCHGGGFIITRSEVHEVYLKKWVADLEGVPIMCLDYSLQAPYPIVFQELLDAYLWVSSGSPDVTEKIGFQPKRIIIAGDSAGGLAGLSILTNLSQIESADSSFHLVYPSDLFFIYGAFLCGGYWSPSRNMMYYDHILNPGTLLIMLGCVTDTQGAIRPRARPSRRLGRALKYTLEDLKLMKSAIRANIKEPWYKNNGDYDLDKVSKMLLSVEDTLYNSLKDFDYDRFSKIRLYLMSTNRCIFLDDNVELAKAWKGPAELHVVHGSIHGFLMIPGEKQAIQFASDILKRASTTN